MAAIFSVAAGKRVRRAPHAQVNLDTRGKEEKAEWCQARTRRIVEYVNGEALCGLLTQLLARRIFVGVHEVAA